MKNKDSYIELLIVIVKRHKGHIVCEILNEYKCVNHINCIGHGTTDSEVADLFGFGIIERDIVVSVIASNKTEKILKDLDTTFHFDERHNGLAFTVPINSIEKNLLDLLNIKEEK